MLSRSVLRARPWSQAGAQTKIVAIRQQTRLLSQADIDDPGMVCPHRLARAAPLPPLLLLSALAMF